VTQTQDINPRTKIYVTQTQEEFNGSKKVQPNNSKFNLLRTSSGLPNNFSDLRSDSPLD
jgi:hypothetical protein